MQLPETETGSSGLYRAVEERTVSSHVLPLTRTVLSQPWSPYPVDEVLQS